MHDESLQPHGEYWRLEAAIRHRVRLMLDVMESEQSFTRSDIVNRCIQVYGFVLGRCLSGERVCTVEVGKPGALLGLRRRLVTQADDLQELQLPVDVGPPQSELLSSELTRLKVALIAKSNSIVEQLHALGVSYGTIVEQAIALRHAVAEEESLGRRLLIFTPGDSHGNLISLEDDVPREP